MANVPALLKAPKDQAAIVTLVSASLFLFMLCLSFDPQWETNDDVAMSMVAHGYGFAAYGSPNLSFSNVLWGHFIRIIPPVNGVLGYSLATMVVLLATGWAMLYFLLRLGAGYVAGLLAVALVIGRPIVFPQFTINAGLLTVAAVIGWQVYARFDEFRILVVASLLAFVGFLVRSLEFFLVLCVALPFIPWRTIQQRRQAQIAFLLLGLAIASAACIDRWSYGGPEWHQFTELNPVRALFNDYGAAENLKQHPEIVARHGYSNNDINLIAEFFFVDPKIADAKRLAAMLAELPQPAMQAEWQSGVKALKMLRAEVLRPLILPALALLLMVPRRSIVFAWVLCLAVLFMTGVMGRPGIIRVYVPLLSFLLVAPLFAAQVKDRTRKWMLLPLFAACVGGTYLLVRDSLGSERLAKQVQRDAKALPTESVVAWGSGFAYEAAFPVIGKNSEFPKITFFPLGVLTYAPYSVAISEEKAGRGMIERMRSTKGVPVIATGGNIEMLKIYCREHFDGELQPIKVHQLSSMPFQRVQCESTAKGTKSKAAVAMKDLKK